MPKRKTPQEKLADLQKEQEALAARIKDAQVKANRQERKDRDRQMIIVGAAVTAHAEVNPEFAKMLSDALRHGVTRKMDREFLVSRGVMNKDPKDDFPEAAE